MQLVQAGAIAAMPVMAAEIQQSPLGKTWRRMMDAITDKEVDLVF